MHGHSFHSSSINTTIRDGFTSVPLVLLIVMFYSSPIYTTFRDTNSSSINTTFLMVLQLKYFDSLLAVLALITLMTYEFTLVSDHPDNHRLRWQDPKDVGRASSGRDLRSYWCVVFCSSSREYSCFFFLNTFTLLQITV